MEDSLTLIYFVLYAFVFIFGCMIGSFQKEALQQVLKLREQLRPLLVLAIGKPDETIVLENVNEQGDTTYYRDAQDVHHVPKRSVRELVINGEDS